MARFVGRQIELQALDRFLSSPQAGLAILYGRRRVGKTALLELPSGRRCGPIGILQVLGAGTLTRSWVGCT
jgi:predicted AAA+ superfamily ATPase